MENGIHNNREGGIGIRYMRMLSKRNTGGLESADADPPDLSDKGIKDRLDSTRSELDRIIKDYLGNDDRYHTIADKIVAEGRAALEVFRKSPETVETDNPIVGALEAIVRTDGTRPTYLVTNGEPDVMSSTKSDFDTQVEGTSFILQQAIACVGRINTNDDGGFKGTGFLVQDNVILTNRHVLQVIAKLNGNNEWIFNAGVHINFGHEYETEFSNRREFEKVLFYGEREAVNPIDHNVLDIVVIQLKPADIIQIPLQIFNITTNPRWKEPGSYIYAIGYPAEPMGGYEPTLLEQLFDKLYGYKRIAPGEIFIPDKVVPEWTAAHDATTLGGNSGSVIVVAGKELGAAGIHYGGRKEFANWSHKFGNVLDQVHPKSGITLKEILFEAEVKII